MKHGGMGLRKACQHLSVLFLLILYAAVPSAAQPSQNRVVILNSPRAQNELQVQLNTEIAAILNDEDNASLKPIDVPVTDDLQRLNALIDSIYADPTTKIIVVSDLSLNQIFAQRTQFPKPTILPFVFDAAFNGLKRVDNTSGTKNLAYISPDFDFVTEFNTLAAVAPIKNAKLITSARILQRLSTAAKSNAISGGREAGFSLSLGSFDGSVETFLNELPANIDAVFIGFLPGSTTQQIKDLFAALTERGIATYPLASEQYVTLGALAANAPAADATRIARRTAIYVSEILSGVRPQTLGVSIDLTSQLTINMATARALNISPPFEVLSSARLLNDIDERPSRTYSLTQVAREAVRENLALMAQRFQAEQAKARIAETRSSLLPQISADLSFVQRREINSVRNGVVAENSTDATISLSQSIFTEEFWAAYDIEKYSALSERELLREVELDIIQGAVETYLGVLLEKTSLEQAIYNLDITRENQRLARNRVEVGTQDKSDLFRWQSELATAKQTVLDANASYEQLRQQLNQILNRPIDEPFAVTVESLKNPDLIITDDRITKLIGNAFDLQVLTEFFVEIGLDRAPEIKQAEVAIDSTNRQLRSDKRQYWLPDFSVVGRYTNNFDETRNLSATGFGGLPAEDDWSVTLQASIPLFEGGARIARVNQSRLAVRQSQASLRNVKNQVEQDIRNALEAVRASFASIPLAQEAEAAAEQNYELVAASYAQGQRDIINVLDAQEALISAREAALNAVFAFLIDLMTTQRAIGGFDFFLDDTQRLEFSSELIRRVDANQRKTKRGVQ